MINGTNYKEHSKSELFDKLRELNEVKFQSLSNEDQQLRDKIYIYLQGEETQDKESTSKILVEESLNALGSVVITVGIGASIGVIVFGVVNEVVLIFYIAGGFVGILFSLVSGYILKGIAKIITLLSDKNL